MAFKKHRWTPSAIRTAEERAYQGGKEGLMLAKIAEDLSVVLGFRVTGSAWAHAFQLGGLENPSRYWKAGRRGEPMPQTRLVLRAAATDTDPAPPPVVSGGDVAQDAQQDDGEDINLEEVDNSSIPPPPAAPPTFELPSHLDSGSGDTGLAECFLRLVIPDSHGMYIDPAAATAILGDVPIIAPKEIVWLGDHIDVSGLYSVHPPNYVKDLGYSLTSDYASAEAFMDAIQKRAPNARGIYLEGNHEQHIERHIARSQNNMRDAEAVLALQSPDKHLRLKERGFKYYRMSEFYDGLSIPGTARLGKCHFTHGFTASKFATAAHVARFGGNVVHGHTHRVQEHGTRTVESDAIGGWCPGTLALLQPLYRHTAPSDWRHGYGLQAVDSRGRFIHINVPIVGGQSWLKILLGQMRPAGFQGGDK